MRSYAFTAAGRAITGPISFGISTGATAYPLGPSNVNRSGGEIMVTWTGGTAPYKVPSKSAVNDPVWTDLVTTTERSVAIPTAAAAGFYRIQSSPAP